MITKIIAPVVLVLVLGTSVAYAATQLTSSDGTQVCVNDVNGLVRIDSTCRVGEHEMTIGGGRGGEVTQGGPFTVQWDATGEGTALPLTEANVAGKCDVMSSPGAPNVGLARLLVTTDGSMTAMAGTPHGSVGTVAGQSFITAPVATAYGSSAFYGTGTAIVSSNEATATITYGAQVDATARSCTFVWQAVEAPD